MHRSFCPGTLSAELDPEGGAFTPPSGGGAPAPLHPQGQTPPQGAGFCLAAKLSVPYNKAPIRLLCKQLDTLKNFTLLNDALDCIDADEQARRESWPKKVGDSEINNLLTGTVFFKTLAGILFSKLFLNNPLVQHGLCGAQPPHNPYRSAAALSHKKRGRLPASGSQKPIVYILIHQYRLLPKCTHCAIFIA